MNRSAPYTLGMALSEAWQMQLRELRACERAVIAGDDAEALHRFRVALRTTRALLRLFQSELPESETLARELAWLSDALNRARDLDIVAQFIQGLAAPSLLNERRALIACSRELAREHAAQRRAVQTLLRGRRYRRLLQEWENYIAHRVREAELPIALHIRAETAQRVIALAQALKLLRRLHRIDNDCAPATLHRLRIRCKRLRYLFEALPQTRTDKKIAALVKALARLQRILGEHQDAVVIRAWFAQLADRHDAAIEIPQTWHIAVERQQRRRLTALPRAWHALVKTCVGI